ncbi:Fe(3+)-hydroxamate ABC transporter permease FhuB [Aliamphritea ceti]|uniref:Fe(3+)-hydroxamate ABC transporter permease FhuB n=1 Tax=Aliamphritea ceti TaxID=1524258 RepID=UPI0021C4BDE2|nr:Fe(3+)-hydroxamate ABC transporter permease FhuB [Aliamphritea ceti]
MTCSAATSIKPNPANDWLQILFRQRYPFTLLLTLLIGSAYLQLDTQLSIAQQWSLINGQIPDEFAEFVYLFATLPRLIIALLVGATLGLAGSLLQQVTRNPLLSPLTLGTSSGAWLALIVVSVWFPSLNPDTTSVLVMAGAMLSMGLVLAIAGIRQLSGLPVVLAGMAVNILLGAITSAIILLRDQHAKQLFIWGAGDLAQNDWQWLGWLAPKLLIAIPVLLLAPRLLQLLKLGQESAGARGLNVTPVLLVLFIATLWLVSASITAVGIISFIGLIAPNIARLCGARSARDQLWLSSLLGALLLLCADLFARLLSLWTIEIIPTGTATAICGAPVLIALALKKLRAEDQLSLQALPVRRIGIYQWVIIILTAVSCFILASFLNHTGISWQWGWPNSFDWQLRSPRIVAAMAAGIAMAVAGTLLQRLIYNPLASPDLLGVSAGASAALVLYTLLFGEPLTSAGPFIALAGSAGLLLILLSLAKRQQFSPAAIILLGISLTALVEALIQFALANGSENVYTILGWLAGSTYRVEAPQAAILLTGSLLILLLGLLSSRWLTLLSIGKPLAQGRGMQVESSIWCLLSIVALACALVTALLGPIAFIGLLAPHMARLLGAQSARSQLITAALLGASLLMLADWLGRNLLYPGQIAAGTLASALGGGYFIILLLRSRARH